MKLVTQAKRLTAALNLGPTNTASVAPTSVTFAGEFTLPVLRRKFRPTTFKFDAESFRFVDKDHRVAASLHGVKMHRTANRFATFRVELTRLA
jgi:hypothetical protein